MYDKQSKGEFVNLDEQIFKSTRFEIWRDLSKIQGGALTTDIFIKSDMAKWPKQDGIHVSIKNDLSEKDLKKDMTFDAAITSSDRYLLCIVPSKSNAEKIDSFSVFLQLIPIRTRMEKNFAINEPHACSIFFVNGKIDKITFTVTLSKTLIEFYK